MSRQSLGYLFALSLLSCQPAFALPKPPNDKNWKSLHTASVDEISAKISVADDPMELFIVTSSYPIYKKNTSLLSAMAGSGQSDNYLRAIIDRKTLNVAYQFVFTTRYMGRYESIQRANYMTQNGPVPSEVKQLDYDLLNCRDSRGCEHYMAVAVAVPRAVLDWAGSRDGSNDDNIWFVRFATAAQVGDRGLHPKEVASLLARTDKEIERLKALAAVVDQ